MRADEKTFDVDFGELRSPTFRRMVDQANQRAAAIEVELSRQYTTQENFLQFQAAYPGVPCTVSREVDYEGEFPRIVVTVRAP